MVDRSLPYRALLALSLSAALLVPAGRCRGAGEAARDLRDSVRARQALQRDPELAALNVGVWVRNRVATLWGPIPTVQLSLRAERALRALFEIAEVRNELEVTEGTTAVATTLPVSVGPTTLPEALPPALPAVTHAVAGEVGVAKAKAAVKRAAEPTPAAERPADLVQPAILLPQIEALPARMPLAPEQAPAKR